MMRLKTVAGICCLLSLFSSQLLAETKNKSAEPTKVEISKTEPLASTDIEYIKKMAASGHPEAQMKLGYAYARGVAVKKNDEKSLSWSLKAAKQGNAKAQYNTGLSYAKGEGVEKDIDEAENWFKKSANQGFAPAKEFIAFINKEKPKHSFDAFSELKKSASAGNANAQYRLAQIYANGSHATLRDKPMAIQWYLRAANNDHAEAQYMMSSMVLEEHKGSNKKKFQWTMKAAKNGHTKAQRNLAIFYGTMDDTPYDHKESYAWMQVAKMNGEQFSKQSESNFKHRLGALKAEADTLAEEYKKLYGKH